jgi:hypothetical protein
MDNILNIGAVVTALIPITVGIVQVLKEALNIDKRFVPLTSVITGLALCPFSLFIVGQNPWYGLFGGLIVGLSACGLYSGTKATKGQ